MNLCTTASQFLVTATAEVHEPHWIEFPKLGILFEGMDTSIKIGSFSIAWYGLIISVGMILCMILGMLNCKRIGLSRDHLTDYLLVSIPSAIVGARLYYVIFEWGRYKDNLLDIFKIWKGGLAIYGGIIGAAIAIIIMAKIRKHSVLNLLDFAMPHIFLGQAIGRWGNFVNQEAFGCETDLPWGMIGDLIQTDPHYVEKVPEGSYVHPTFLYESLWCFLGFIILYIYFIKFRKGKGEVLALYFFIYGIERAIVEGLRVDNLDVGGIHVSQLLSIALVIISVPFFIDCRRRYKKESLSTVIDPDCRTNLTELADKVRSEEDLSEDVDKADSDDGNTELTDDDSNDSDDGSDVATDDNDDVNESDITTESDDDTREDVGDETDINENI